MEFRRINCTAFLGLAIVLWLPQASSLPTVFLPMLAIVQSQLTPKEQADQLLNQGFEQYRNRQIEAAIESWQQALVLYRQSQDRSGEANVLRWLGTAYVSLPAYEQAIEYLQPALTIIQEAGDRSHEAAILSNLGIAYRGIGQYTRAIQLQQQALEAAQRLGEQALQLQNQILSNLGNAYESVGDYDAAIDAYQQSLTIVHEMGDLQGKGIVLGNLGGIYILQGNYDQAISIGKESLAVAEELNDHRGQAQVLLNLGSASDVQNNRIAAVDYYQQSLAIAQELGDRDLQYQALTSLGNADEDAKNYLEAIDYHEQALVIARAIGNPRAEAIVLNNLGHTLLAAGRLPEAEARLREAINLWESLRPENLSDLYNVAVFDTQVFSYSLLTQILVAQGKIEEALEASEQSRARAFVRILAQRLSPSQDVRSIQSMTSSPKMEQIRQIAKEQNATLVEYMLIADDNFKFQGRLRGKASKLWIWVVQPSGEVAFREVNLDSSELPLNQLVSETRSSIGVRSRSTSQEPIRPGDRVLRLDEANRVPYEVVAVDAQTGLLTLRNPEFILPAPVSAAEVYRVAGQSGDRPRFQQLHQLLIGHIQDLLPSNDPEARVIFIPTEELFSVPFAALQDADENYLLQKHTILTAPAIQVLELTHQRRQHLSATAHSALVVGNPIPMPDNLSSLPFAEDEAKAVAESLHVDALVGEAATESAVRQRLSDAKVIHLATHGTFNEAAPLQGAIALAPDSQDDGMLTAEEILNYQLNAELVVLSACDTGQGKITGDGVIGLSRSWIAAGTPSVIVSLWKVPDDATNRLMTAFYNNRKQGLDNAQALRQAMISTMQKYPDPQNWAAFTLIGEAE